MTLQENNAIAVIDLRRARVDRAFSAGSVDLSGIDPVEDGAIEATGSLTDVPREPDGVAWIDDTLIATANEGDLNGGSRGWSILNGRTGKVVWDAGNTFERLAMSAGLYPESRSENKGAEPENITVATIKGRRYALVGAERGNFVAVYDLATATRPRFLQVLPVTNGPEGLLAIPARELFVISSEVDVPEDTVRATISLFRLGRDKPEFPQLHSADTAAGPIGWGALSGLSADPRHRNRLWSVSDGYYSPTKLFSITTHGDGPNSRGLISSTLTVTESGQPVSVDAEGVAARAGGGFWLAAEGATGGGNEILRLDSTAAVRQRIALSADVAAGLGSRGLEGIAVTGRGDNEQILVVLQSPLTGDPSGVTRIGRYKMSSQTWTWYGYRLDVGSSIGLSELVTLGGDRFAVLERDNLAGPTATVKRIYTVDLIAANPGSLPMLPKQLVRDLVPDLSATNGWIQEKTEGLPSVATGTFIS